MSGVYGMHTCRFNARARSQKALVAGVSTSGSNVNMLAVVLSLDAQAILNA